MHIRFTRFLLVPVTTLFCTLPFALNVSAAAGNNKGNDKIYVCHLLPNGKFNTQQLPEKTAIKLSEEHPHEWILYKKCEDVISPSHP